jgi:hypothetical protein
VTLSGPRKSCVSAAAKRSRKPLCTSENASTASWMPESIELLIACVSLKSSATPSRSSTWKIAQRKIWYSSISAAWL